LLKDVVAEERCYGKADVDEDIVAEDVVTEKDMVAEDDDFVRARLQLSSPKTSFTVCPMTFFTG
jgi:hypothetical protein